MNDGFISYIKADYARFDKTPTLMRFLKYYMFPQGDPIRYQVWLRATHFSKKRKLTKYTIGVFCYWRLRHYEFKYGLHANSNIEIGKGLKIVHGETVHLNCERIGEHCTFYPNVMLGGQPGRSGLPIVEDNVTVYTGAVCCGKIILHEGCQVAACSYVGQDVKNYTLVGGVPAKTIKSLRILSEKE